MINEYTEYIEKIGREVKESANQLKKRDPLRTLEYPELEYLTLSKEDIENNAYKILEI